MYQFELANFVGARFPRPWFAIWYPFAYLGRGNPAPTLSLLHYKDVQWQDVPVSVDIYSNRICGQITGFSEFAVAAAIVTTGGGSSGDGGGGGKCFIATAAFGTPLAQEVQVLRRFRDTYLLTNSLGQEFVSLYYRLSPPVADFIRDNSILKATVRTILRPVVWLAESVLPPATKEENAVSNQQPLPTAQKDK